MHLEDDTIRILSVVTLSNGLADFRRITLLFWLCAMQRHGVVLDAPSLQNSLPGGEYYHSHSWKVTLFFSVSARRT